MSKRAQSISIDTIIVAAIAIVVMILLVMIFTGNITRFRRGTDACSSYRGKCVDLRDYQAGTVCNGVYESVSEYACPDAEGNPDPEKICCVST